jgi:hypothetical protein
MKHRLSIFATSATVAALSLLVSCSEQADPSPANTAGSPVGGSSPAASGFGGLGSGGQSTSAIGGGGSGGQITAAVGGGGAPGGASGGSGASGSSGASGGDGAATPTFETVKFAIMNAPCFGAGCHNDDQNPLNLRIDEQLHSRLTTHVSKNCGNLPIVNPGKPDESALVKILKGPCTPTPRMPLGCVDDQDANCIPPEYIAAIAQWIASGAPQQ